MARGWLFSKTKDCIVLCALETGRLNRNFKKTQLFRIKPDHGPGAISNVEQIEPIRSTEEQLKLAWNNQEVSGANEE